MTAVASERPDVDGRPAGVDASAPLARANPVAKLAVCVLLPVVLLLSVDPVSAGTALALELAALPWCGLGVRALWRRGWVVVAGAVPAGVATTWLGVDAGAVLLALGPVTVTEGSLLDGVSVTARVLAIGLPGVVLLATTDPTDLADALAQVLRLPARPVLAALAALRLLGVLAEEWRSLQLARRARGLGDDGPVGRARTAAQTAFALLVIAVRRGAVMATAMEARGFGARDDAGRLRPRTWARESRLRGGDVLVMAGGAVLAGLSVTAAVLAGTWDPTLT